VFFEWSSIFRDHADQNKVFRLEIHGFTMNCDTSAARDNCHRQVDHFLESNSQFISYPRIINFFSIGATPFLRQRDRSMSDYLTAHELADLVGCKPNQRAAMTRWLDLNHWRFVVDKTGLSGSYDFTLTWTPDQMPGAGQRPPGAPEPPPIDPNGASLFTAVQEQLGLKLDSQRGPVAMLVIDRAERPTEN